MKNAELLETFPSRHALVLLGGVVPCLDRTREMVGVKPGTIGRESALTPKEVVTLIELI